MSINPIRYANKTVDQQDAALSATSAYKAGMAALTSATWNKDSVRAVDNMLWHAINHGDGDMLQAIGRELDKQTKGATGKKAEDLKTLRGTLQGRAEGTTLTRTKDTGGYQSANADNAGWQQLYTPSGPVAQIETPVASAGADNASDLSNLQFKQKRDVDFLSSSSSASGGIGGMFRTVLDPADKGKNALDALSAQLKPFMADAKADTRQLHAIGRLLHKMGTDGEKIMSELQAAATKKDATPTQQKNFAAIASSAAARDEGRLDIEEVTSAVAHNPALLGEAKFLQQAMAAMAATMSGEAKPGRERGVIETAKLLKAAFKELQTPPAGQDEITKAFFGDEAKLDAVAGGVTKPSEDFLTTVDPKSKKTNPTIFAFASGQTSVF